MADWHESYDVVVVGSGSGGAVVVRRLVDAGASVLLLEAGGSDMNPMIQVPSRVLELWGTEQDWDYTTVPQTACDGRVLHWPRGKVLGGSSSLNGMIYVRGHRSDYDTWAYLGNAGWGYEDVLPLFKRSEDFDRGESRYHGIGGPMRVLTRYAPHPLLAACVAASQEAGIPLNDDYNGEAIEGVAFCQLTIRDGVRLNTNGAFLDPVRDEPNLTILTHALATRLVFESGRCTGVDFVQEGSVRHAHARHEVVVCAGTLESPKLLLLSGIGPAQDLAPLGIDIRVDLPGVGQNLHDHVLSPLVYSSSRAVPPPLDGLTQLHAHLFWHTRSGLPAPDQQPLFFHMPLYPEGYEGPPDGFTLLSGAIRPASRGSLRLASADPSVRPVVDPAYLGRAVDLDAMVAGVELCREIARQDALGDWRGDEIAPGPAVRTTDDVRAYVRRTAITYHHQVGTCKMGVDELAVVDPELRVYGVEGLRVADASVMPFVTSGNTHAPVVMIGERAADLVAAGLGVTRAEEAIGV
jgi:choline dehydrogenase